MGMPTVEEGTGKGGGSGNGMEYPRKSMAKCCCKSHLSGLYLSYFKEYGSSASLEESEVMGHILDMKDFKHNTWFIA